MPNATATTTVTFDTLNGLFKDQFAPEVENLIPDHVLLQKGLIDWIPQDKQPGEFYSIPTVLKSNQGVTYGGESGSVTALKDAKPGLMKEAQIKGSEMILRGQLSYAVLARAATAGNKAFKKASAWLVEDLTQVAFTRAEIAALYGQDSLGIIETVNSGPAGTAGDPYLITISEASFSPGMWVLLEGASLEIFATGASGDRRGSLVFTVQTVDTANRIIGLSEAGPAITNVVATDTLHFEGARASNGDTYNEMAGLKVQMSATSGTLFNIARTYALMKGNPVAHGSVELTKAALLSYCMKAVDKGAMSKLTALVGTKTFATLHAEFLGLERFNRSGGSEKEEAGAEKIAYRSVFGSLEIVCHPLVKNGDCFVFNPDDVIWVGSRKPGFEIPGTEGSYFDKVEGATAVELQNYSDMAIYVHKPARTVMITGIQN